jgi:hypothetical protein
MIAAIVGAAKGLKLLRAPGSFSSHGTGRHVFPQPAETLAQRRCQLINIESSIPGEGETPPSIVAPKAMFFPLRAPQEKRTA